MEEFIKRQNILAEKLCHGKTLIITFGTSIAYFRKSNDTIVGNCHKQPADLFYRERLQVNDIAHAWDFLIKNMNNTYKGLNIIFTVSPVRHLKDTMEGNSKSKAILLLAIEQICSLHENCHYFPAFEIMNDDLRDYRFYASDLLHPSEEAIEYIWEKFVDTYIDSSGKTFLEEGAKKVRAANHRPKIGALGKPIEKGSHL